MSETEYEMPPSAERSKGQRGRILRLLQERNDPADAMDIANFTGLHVTTARFHLDALCLSGEVRRTKISSNSVGRPRTGYLALSEDQIDYEVLAGALAEEIENTPGGNARSEVAGMNLAMRIGRPPDFTKGISDENALNNATTKVFAEFERMGFAPVRATDTDHESPNYSAEEELVYLHSCPVRDLARRHPNVVCNVHLGLIKGLVSEYEKSETLSLHSQLEPFVGPNLCLMRISVNDPKRAPQPATQPEG